MSSPDQKPSPPGRFIPGSGAHARFVTRLIADTLPSAILASLGAGVPTLVVAHSLRTVGPHLPGLWDGTADRRAVARRVLEDTAAEVAATVIGNGIYRRILNPNRLSAVRRGLASAMRAGVQAGTRDAVRSLFAGHRDATVKKSSSC